MAINRGAVHFWLACHAGVGHFGFQAIRHQVASYPADTQKFSIAQVSRRLRHQSKATTERYTGD
jgi:hypothetical protein